MTRRVIWAGSARDDYLAILGYIARDNPDAAARVAGRIDETAPALGAFAIGRPGRVRNTYEKVVTGLPYILAYELVADPAGGEMVAILHVIHGARDWPEGRWPTV